jgi:hypothetical protein
MSAFASTQTSTTIIRYRNTDGNEALFGLKVDDRVYFTAKGTITQPVGDSEFTVDNIITTITKVTNKYNVEYKLKNNDADADFEGIKLPP